MHSQKYDPLQETIAVRRPEDIDAKVRYNIEKDAAGAALCLHTTKPFPYVRARAPFFCEPAGTEPFSTQPAISLWCHRIEKRSIRRSLSRPLP